MWNKLFDPKNTLGTFSPIQAGLSKGGTEMRGIWYVAMLVIGYISVLIG